MFEFNSNGYVHLVKEFTLLILQSYTNNIYEQRDIGLKIG